LAGCGNAARIRIMLANCLGCAALSVKSPVEIESHPAARGRPDAECHIVCVYVSSVQRKNCRRDTDSAASDNVREPMGVVVYSQVSGETRNPITHEPAGPAVVIRSRLGHDGANC